jgi:hypothetical protein
MTDLTRRRDPDRAGEAWLIHYADVEVGQIEKVEGLPRVGVTWHWRCGFYPGCEPGEIRGGDAATFEEARTAFETAWRVVPVPANRSRFPGLARSARLDGREVPPL